MTTTPNSAQQSHLKSRGWRQRLTASGLVLVSPALLAVGIATAAHANASSVTGANLTGETSISGNAVQPTTHTAFPKQASGHTEEVQSAFRGQHGATVHHRHRGSKTGQGQGESE
jgi:hypothetical protein